MAKRIFIITTVLSLVLFFLPTSFKILITRYPRIVLLLPLHGIEGFLRLVRVHEQEYRTLSEYATSLTLENARLIDEIRRQKFTASANYPQLVLAQIISRDHETGVRYLTLNKSVHDNVKVNMPVLTAYGMVGKIIESTENQSIVETALSPSLKISALNSRSQVVGVVEYSHFDKLRFKYAFDESDIQTNDTIVTSGIGGIFPRGINIGVVLKVDVDPTSFFQYVDVQPMVNFNTLEHIFVYTKEIAPFSESGASPRRWQNLYELKIETPTSPRIR